MKPLPPVMLHADGSACGHEGQPKRGPGDPGGPVCAGGREVTHAWAGGRKIPIGEAWHLLADAYGRNK